MIALATDVPARVTDAALVASALARVERYSSREAARVLSAASTAAGEAPISAGNLQRWREETWKRLFPSTRRALEAALGDGRATMEAGDREELVRRLKAMRDELDEILAALATPPASSPP